MKRLLPFLLLAASLTATAQTLRVSRNRVHHVFAATPDVMTFAADASSYTVTIGGVTYNTQEIDSIVFKTPAMPERHINKIGEKPFLTIFFDPNHTTDSPAVRAIAAISMEISFMLPIQFVSIM